MADELAEAPTLQETAPVTQPDESPVVSQGLRDAFSAARTAEEKAPEAATPTATETAPPAEKPADKATAPDYGDLLKDLGVESVDALKTSWQARKELDPEAYKTATANQRDDHDKAVREMLDNPAKARAYFELQTLKPDELAKGDADQQRQLLFENFKLANPQFTGRLAEIEFEDEYEQKYALATSDDTDDPAVERAKLRLEAALGVAAPAVKAAQDAARIAVLPKADEPTPEQKQAKEADLAAYTKSWAAGMEQLEKAPVQHKFQSEFGEVTAAYDLTTPDAKAFMDDPMAWIEARLHNEVDMSGYKTGKPTDLTNLAKIYGAITQLDAVVKASAAVGKASVRAHVPMDKITNPAPQAQLEGGNNAPSLQSAFANAKSV